MLSAVIGIVSCMAGLAIASAGVFGWGKLVIAGLFMGVGVTGMHYTGMAAATFMPIETAVVTDGLSGAYLGMSIFGVTTVLLSAVLSISLMRQRQRELVQI